MTTSSRLVAILLAAIVLLAGIMLAIPRYNLPACFEDQVLVGAGSYDNHQWEYYNCGPAVDDYNGQ